MLFNSGFCADGLYKVNSALQGILICVAYRYAMILSVYSILSSRMKLTALGRCLYQGLARPLSRVFETFKQNWLRIRQGRHLVIHVNDNNGYAIRLTQFYGQKNLTHRNQFPSNLTILTFYL